MVVGSACVAIVEPQKPMGEVVVCTSAGSGWDCVGGAQSNGRWLVLSFPEGAS